MSPRSFGCIMLVLLLAVAVILLGVGTGTSNWIAFSYNKTSTFKTSLWYHVVCIPGIDSCQTITHSKLDTVLKELDDTVYSNYVNYTELLVDKEGINWLECGIEALVGWTFCFIALVTSCCGCIASSKKGNSYICRVFVLMFFLVGGAITCIPAARAVSAFMNIKNNLEDDEDIEILDPWSLWIFLAGAASALLGSVILFIVVCQTLIQNKGQRKSRKILTATDPHALPPFLSANPRKKKKRRIFLMAPKPPPQPVVQTIVVKEKVPVPVPIGGPLPFRMENIRELPVPDPFPSVTLTEVEDETPVYAVVQKKKRQSYRSSSNQEYILRSSESRSRDSSRKSTSTKSYDAANDHFIPDSTDERYFSNGRINSQFGHSRNEHLNFHPDEQTPKYGTILDVKNDMYRHKSSRKKGHNSLRRSVPADFERKANKSHNPLRRTASLKPKDRGTDQKKTRSSRSDPNLLERKPRKKHCTRQYTEAKQLQTVVPSKELDLTKSEDVMSDTNAFIRSKEERDVDEIYFTGSILRGGI